MEEKPQYQKEYKKTKKGKDTQKRYYVSDAKKKASKRWREKPENKVKIRAHRIIEGMIRRGELSKEPCEVCADERAQAHHDDYSRPFQVRWLCNFHHSEYHREQDLIKKTREVVKENG